MCYLRLVLSTLVCKKRCRTCSKNSEGERKGRMEMRTDVLEKHIIDTVKEWQMKIGYQNGGMKLYYPGESLKEDLETDDLQNALYVFGREVQPRLGKIEITHSGDRYCLDIPEQGCRAISETVPEPEFLSRLLHVITAGNGSMEQVRKCFRDFAEERNTVVVESDETEHEAGCVFYFEDGKMDEYVYCVEENEFGLTYHRFSRADYEVL